jgi:hypothetical protein
MGSGVYTFCKIESRIECDTDSPMYVLGGLHRDDRTIPTITRRDEPK